MLNQHGRWPRPGRRHLTFIHPAGGTVGDIESAPFVHAMSQLQRRAGKGNFLQIHVSYVPVIP